MSVVRDKELLRIGEEIRNIIAEKQKEWSLSFVEETHTYYIKNKDNIIVDDFPSVSTVIKQFYEPFDDLTKSLEMCGGDILEQDKLLKEWRASADYANNQGSRVHFLLETDLLKMYNYNKEVRKPIFNCNKEQIFFGNQMVNAGHNFIRKMHRRGAVLLDTEMVLGSPTLGYTGQPDKVWLMRGKNNELGFIITDWKGLSLDTPILTNNGWKTMGTLTKSDKVYDKDGNLVNILNISKVKNKKCYKIIFDNGDEIISDYEHRWLVSIENDNKSNGIVITTEDIDNYINKLGKVVKIDNPKPLINNNIKLPIIPYLLGIKLSKTLDKIPDEYFLSSYDQRLELLKGIMDRIGLVDYDKNIYYIRTTSETFVDSLVKLIASLGIKPIVTNDIKKIYSEKIKYYNVEFNVTNINPFFIIGKECVVDKNENSECRVITGIYEIESVPTKCIEVDSPTHTFLCGNTLLVTHNTNKPKNFEVQHYTGKLLPPFEKYNDTSLEHYKIQLPLYGRLLLNMLEGSKYSDIKFLGCIIVHLLENGTYEEYRVENGFIKRVLNMGPLVRIDEVMEHKRIMESREKDRIKLVKTLLNG